MRNIKLLALFLIIGTALAVTSVTPNTGLCTCSQIQYKDDCNAVSIPNANSSLSPTACTWNANPNATGTQAKGTCVTQTTTTPVVTPVATFCSGISVANCPSTVGCALPDAKTCQAFSGCSSYVFTTNAACQAVSTQCTTDGTQCATKQPCSFYTATIANCGIYSSSSGTGTCKVSGTSCVDQSCTDAPTTLTTDAACNTFLTGCVSSGAGCLTARVACSSITGTATTCPTLLGLSSEGLCKYPGTGTNCAARTCADAATTLTTNAQCIAFLSTCLYTIGKGCVSTTSSCSQLTFSLGCSGLVNTSGVACTNNTSATPAVACREITCTDNTTATTDAACNTNGLTGCVTNGAGCVSSGSFSCSSYTGTNTQCGSYIGSTGPCKGAAANSTTSQACVVKTCADAPSTTKTNKDCAAVQTGCVTTGYGCVSTLSACSSYTPTASTPCDGYIGSDGPCTLIASATTCSARTCPGASTTTLSGVITTTNSGCQAWFPYISASLPGCVTTGTACVAAGTCSTLNQTSCTGYSTCSFTKSCVQNNACSFYLTQSQCISNTGAFSRSCTWNGSSCAPTACPVSSASITSDGSCQGSGATATPGCYYQGTGTTCVDGIGLTNSSCGSFTGDNTFVASKGCYALFNNQCASSNSSVATPTSCVARTCANFYQTNAGTTTNSQCNSWLTGCISNNYQGCVLSNADCTNFFGTQAGCDALTAAGARCYNTNASAAASSPCVIKTAAMILSTAVNQLWTDSQCSTALSTSASSQITIAATATTGVCVPKANPCSTFNGNLALCNSITTLTLGKCSKTSQFCYPKAVPTCANLTGATITACQTLYYACTWASGSNCVALGACSTYTATAANCNALRDNNGLRCGSTQSASAACISASYCTDYNTGGSSTATTYCPTLTDALGNTCAATTGSDAFCSYAVAISKVALGYKQCASGQILAAGKCTTPGTLTCSNLAGSYFTAQSSPANCASVSSTCTWITAGTTCIAAGACTGYTLAAPATAILGNTYCAQYRGASNIPCQYVGVSGGTQTAVNCVDAPAACTSYTADSMGQAASAAVCRQFLNAGGRYCGFITGTLTCVEPAACSTQTTSTANLTGATLCQGTIDQTTFTPCSIPAASTTTCTSGVAACTGYAPPSGATPTESATLCQGYFTAAGVKCGFISGASACSIRSCSDQGTSSSNCATYLAGCVWTGTTCVANSTINNCTQYVYTSQATCNALFDNKGRQCNWITGSTCVDYQCSSYPALASSAASTHAKCQLQNFACTSATPLSGGKCQTIQSSCFKYVVAAADIAGCSELADAAGIPCSAPTSPPASTNVPCAYGVVLPAAGSVSVANCNNPGWTYTAGSPATCTGTSTIVASCSAQAATGATFAAQLAFCQSLTSNIYGTPCFFAQYNVSGTAQTNCVDSVLPGAQTQLVYAPNCPVANVSNTPVGGSASSGLGNDADCAAFSSGCTATLTLAVASTPATACTILTCPMASATIATSTSACQGYQTGCIWNGLTGCIVESTSSCANITGTVTSCATFVVNKNPCYQSLATATTTATATACAAVTCANAPTTITTNSGCETWYPSSYHNLYNATTNPGPNLNCVWTGTTGCISPQACSSFVGNATTCPTFIANDGPCKAGTGSNCTPLLCADAPNSLNTDTACAKYANSSQQCLTTGYGCIAKTSLSCTSIVNQTSCAASTFGGASTAVCSWLSTCVSSVTSCTDSSLSTATLCLSTPVTGATCAWNPTTNACQNITCALLPATLTSHTACSTALNTCTTTGAGCITLGTCASYTSAGQAACLAANNKEVSTSPQVTKCIWANSACRVIACADNTTATTNAACNVNGLTGCVTTGLGCAAAGAFTCTSLTTAAACLVDGSNSPCLWINGACQSYTACTSVAWTTYAQCQRIIPITGVASGCTSNGATCIALNSCANYTTSVACNTSNQKQTCGWLPANSKSNANPVCQVFGACTDAAGTTNDACKLYGAACISDGTKCMLASTCSSYTQYACNNNAGTDGTCFWQAASATVTTASCRTQQCGDVTAAYTAGSTTDAACAAFQAPIINQCTTNGTSCVARSTCGSYTTQIGCVTGTDGTCFWVAPAATAAAGTVGTCRVKACTDSIFTSSSACATAILSTPAKSIIANGVTTTTPAAFLACVSNGTNCIAKSTCGSYVNQAACQGAGTDGDCAFTPGTNATTPTIGTCAQFSACTVANSDSVACGKATDRCFWSSTTTGTTTATSCQPITCAQAATGTCKPIPSFNKATYSICAPVSSTNTTCTAQDGSASPVSTCFSGSLGQYTWNDTSSTCSYCSQTVTPTPNNTNTTNTTTYGSVIASSFLIYGAILAIY